MFKIYDGRENFYQWDLNRKLIVEDPSITEVHFCNRTGECSLVCETYVEDGVTLVNVPNILLQTDWKIRVYAYDSSYTKHDGCFEVVSRTKPSDYIYMETEIRSLDALTKEMEILQEDSESLWIVSTEAVSEAYSAKSIAQKAEAIAKGKATGYVFDTETAMNEWLENADNVEKLKLGDNLYIREVNVPDYWWDGEAKQRLETQKVNLDEYATKSSVDNLCAELQEQITTIQQDMETHCYPHIVAYGYEDIRLQDGYEYRFTTLIKDYIGFMLPEEGYANSFESSVIFTTHANATDIVLGRDFNIVFFGDDVDSYGDFHPQPNTTYEISFKCVGTSAGSTVAARVGSWR